MDDPTVRLLIVQWLDLSDALAIRSVSLDWWQEAALSIEDDAAWESLVEATHGAAVAKVVRMIFPTLRGWQLVKRVHREGRRDDRQVSALKLEDIACMVELSWKNIPRKIHLASFVVEKLWTDRAGHHHTQTTGLPSVYFPESFDPRHTEFEIAQNLEVRVTLFRRDTQQRFSLILEHSGSGFDGTESIFQECILRRPEYTIQMHAYFIWAHWRKNDGKTAVLNLDKFCFSLLRGDIDAETGNWEVDPFEGAGELLAAVDRFPWK